MCCSCLNYQPAALNAPAVNVEEKKSANATHVNQPAKRNVRQTQPLHLAVNQEQADLEEKLFLMLREMLYSHNALDFFESQVLTGGTQLDQKFHPRVARYYNGGIDCVPAKHTVPAHAAKIIDMLKPEFMSDTPGDPSEPWRFKLLHISTAAEDAIAYRHLKIFKPLERTAAMGQIYKVLFNALRNLDNLTEADLNDTQTQLQTICPAFNSPALLNPRKESYFRQGFGHDL